MNYEVPSLSALTSQFFFIRLLMSLAKCYLNYGTMDEVIRIYQAGHTSVVSRGMILRCGYSSLPVYDET